MDNFKILMLLFTFGLFIIALLTFIFSSAKEKTTLLLPIAKWLKQFNQ